MVWECLWKAILMFFHSPLRSPNLRKNIPQTRTIPRVSQYTLNTSRSPDMHPLRGGKVNKADVISIIVVENRQ